MNNKKETTPRSLAKEQLVKIMNMKFENDIKVKFEYQESSMDDKKELNDSIAKRILKKITEEGYRHSGDKSIVLEIILVKEKEPLINN